MILEDSSDESIHQSGFLIDTSPIPSLSESFDHYTVDGLISTTFITLGLSLLGVALNSAGTNPSDVYVYWLFSSLY